MVLQILKGLNASENPLDNLNCMLYFCNNRVNHKDKTEMEKSVRQQIAFTVHPIMLVCFHTVIMI